MTMTAQPVSDEQLREAAREAAASLLALTVRETTSPDVCPACGSVPANRHHGPRSKFENRALGDGRSVPPAPSRTRGSSNPGAGVRRPTHSPA
jgi:hypothetical protein